MRTCTSDRIKPATVPSVVGYGLANNDMVQEMVEFGCFFDGTCCRGTEIGVAGGRVFLSSQSSHGLNK